MNVFRTAAAVTAFLTLTGCFSFSSYVTEPPSDIPLLTPIAPPENPPEQPPPDFSNLLEAEKTAVSICRIADQGFSNT